MGFALSQRERLYVVPEVSYGVLVTPVTTDAINFIEMNPKGDQEFIERGDKTGSRTRPRAIAGGNRRGDLTVNCYLIPSGTAATAPDLDEVLKNLFGTKTVINTTAAAGSTSSVVNVASATGIATGTILGWTTEMRPVASVAGTAITMRIPFSGAPQTGEAIKAVNYSLADAAASSLNVYSYISELPLCAVGVVFGRGVFNFQDGILALQLTGIGSDVLDTGLAAEPATQTYSGLPVSRSFGKIYLDTTSADILDFSIEMDNGDVARQIPVGSQVTTGISRGLRTVRDNFRVYLTDVTKAFYTLAKNRTPQALFVQIGNTSGAMWGFELPTRILQIPDRPMDQPEVQLEFSNNLAYGTGNNEFFIAAG